MLVYVTDDVYSGDALLVRSLLLGGLCGVLFVCVRMSASRTSLWQMIRHCSDDDDDMLTKDAVVVVIVDIGVTRPHMYMLCAV